jgi:hypothetical protein
MKFRSGTSSRTSVQVDIKLARLLELPEGDFAGRVRKLEADVLFQRLLHAKVISVQPYAGAGFMTQRELSDRLDISPSVLNRLISNKSVQLPWGGLRPR